MVTTSSTQGGRTLAGIAHLLIVASVFGVFANLIIWLQHRGRSPYVAH